jgi:hypothetical protein
MVENNELWNTTETVGYEVSNMGRVRSIKRMVRSHTGFMRVQNERILSPAFKSKEGNSYAFVNIYHNGIGKIKYIHRLVAIAFLPNPLNKETVNHIDGNKSNNCLSNLEWATYAENNKHAVDTGLKTRTRGLKVLQISLSGIEINSFVSVSEASRQTGVCRGSIAECVKPFRTNQGHSAGGFKWKYAD